MRGGTVDDKDQVRLGVHIKAPPAKQVWFQSHSKRRSVLEVAPEEARLAWPPFSRSQWGKHRRAGK